MLYQSVNKGIKQYDIHGNLGSRPIVFYLKSISNYNKSNDISVIADEYENNGIFDLQKYPKWELDQVNNYRMTLPALNTISNRNSNNIGYLIYSISDSRIPNIVLLTFFSNISA